MEHDPQKSGAEPATGALEQVLTAERKAERQLAEARAKCEDISRRAHMAAQAVDRATDRRIEACRRAFGKKTAEIEREILTSVPEIRSTGRQPIGESHAQAAARAMAERLIGARP